MKTAKVIIKVIELECPHCHELIKAKDGTTSIHADMAEKWEQIAPHRQVCPNCSGAYWLPIRNPFKRT